MERLKRQKAFEEIFGEGGDIHHFFAPGRINLIGEHTDYNGGFVFPASISYGTYAVARKREDQTIQFYSLNFDALGLMQSDLSDLAYRKADHWTNYPKGMTKLLMDAGFEINTGYDVLYFGNIPNGAGLSSSASIELVTGVMIEKLFALNLDRIALVKLGQQVENNYIGVNSGIMDQFAIGMGKAKHAILLDCDTLDYHYAPIDLKDYVIMIMNTNKRRELAESKYNERRAQCEAALLDLQTELEITSLGALSLQAFESKKHLIKDPIHRKRAKHAVYENQRTKDAFSKLHEGDLVALGQLLNASHHSLKTDYEVTGIELDTLAETAQKQPGVLGARMTGAGFGGCAIALVHRDQVEPFSANVSQTYEKTVGYLPSFYMATIGDGAKWLSPTSNES